MKYLISFVALLFYLITTGFAAPKSVDPVEIVPITKAAYDYAFYNEQAELWKQETEVDKENAHAWYNFYKAARYANMRSDSLSKKYDLDAIVGSLPTSLANTFEFNYILYIHENWSDDRFDHLLKAHEIEPERIDAFYPLITYNLTNGNQEQVDFFCEKLFKAGEFPPSLMAWNYNTLHSLEKNGILLTHGDNDTYPAWVIQSVKKVRPDVKVLNVNLLIYNTYRERVFEEMGLENFSSSEFPDYKDMYLAITRQFMQQAERPVYVATSVPEFIRNALGDSLYLVGLAFKYSPVPFDNVAFLKNNFEKKFLKDHLRIQLEPDTGSNVMANMNMHYLPAIITLRNHYKDSGDQTKANELTPMIRQIAEEAGKEAFISQYLGEEPDLPADFVSTISVRTLQKGMMKIRNDFYAAATEVTNEQYELFLMDLLKNKEYELLEKCKAPKTNWRSLLPEHFTQLSDAQLFVNGHPDDPKAPVQNISHEAAQEYCKWITKVYNSSTDKKKEYLKVEFRLPTEKEWEHAAHGNHTAPYPWGGYYSRNAKGCFLMNLKADEEDPCLDCPTKGKDQANDGAFFPVRSNAYFPNDLGLYNCSGNVAEMIDVKGIAKGGSWEDKQDECIITARKEYNSPSPAIGFRVFMKVK